MQQRDESKQNNSSLVPVVAFFAMSIIVAFVISQLWVANREEQQTHAKNLAQQVVVNLTTTMNEFFDYTQFWRSYVLKNKGTAPDFDNIAESLYSANNCIDSIQLAPDGIITYSYPKISDIDSTNLFDDPIHRDDAQYSRLTSLSTITGPFPKRRGGSGLTIRTPIFLKAKDNSQTFWGFSTVTLRAEEIFKEAHLPDLKDDDYHYQLKSINPHKGKLDMIHCSTYNTLKNPVSITFSVHNTAWILFIAPKKGWVNYSIIIFEIIIGLIFTLLISFSAASVWNLVRRESTFKKLSYIDALTKLQNNRKFYETLNQLHSQEKAFAILYIDLNKFKPINDNYGHRSGDELLIIVSKKLKNCIREGDEVFRIGGDEYAVIVPNQITINGLSNLVQRIKNSISRTTVLGNSTVQISAAIGYARYPQDGNSYENIVQIAEEMMYADKKSMGEDR